MTKLITAAAIALVLSSAAVTASSTEPGTDIGIVAANDSVYLYKKFYVGREATVYLDGDCDSDIDLWVYDQNGFLIEKSTTHDCDEYVSWTPAWTGEFKIVIENQNKPVSSSFTVTTN